MLVKKNFSFRVYKMCHLMTQLLVFKSAHFTCVTIKQLSFY